MVADGRMFSNEFHLRRFVLLYFLIGVIERELRNSDYSGCICGAELGYLSLARHCSGSYENLKNISMALVTKNSGTSDGIERHLPFAFWRRLFIGEYFSSHWVPALHQVFPCPFRSIKPRRHQIKWDRDYSKPIKSGIELRTSILKVQRSMRMRRK